MGADIELYAEHRSSSEAPWEKVEGFFYDIRNSSVYAVLCPIWKDIHEPPAPSIQEWRGAPEDLSPDLRAINNGDELGWGSEIVLREREWSGWITLRELENYDWSFRCVRRGYSDNEPMSKHAANLHGMLPQLRSLGGPALG